MKPNKLMNHATRKAKKPKNDTFTIGSRIKTIRKKAGLTMVELREKTGIAQSTISAYEQNKIVPNAKAILALAKALNVDFNHILGDSIEPNIISDKDLLERYHLLPNSLKILITQIFELTDAWMKIDNLVNQGKAKLLKDSKLSLSSI